MKTTDKPTELTSVQATQSMAAAEYACPMKCEGDKTYPEPGRCPVCGMHLKPTE